VIVTQDSASNSEDKGAEALCVSADEGLSAIGGGAELRGATDGVVLVETRPVGLEGETPRGWTASAAEINDQPGTWVIRVYAICAVVN
jgi:hypothetical protein